MKLRSGLGSGNQQAPKKEEGPGGGRLSYFLGACSLASCSLKNLHDGVRPPTLHDEIDRFVDGSLHRLVAVEPPRLRVIKALYDHHGTGIVGGLENTRHALPPGRFDGTLRVVCCDDERLMVAELLGDWPSALHADRESIQALRDPGRHVPNEFCHVTLWIPPAMHVLENRFTRLEYAGIDAWWKVGSDVRLNAAHQGESRV